MDFKKRLNLRLYVSLGYIIMGIILELLPFFVKSDDIISSFGLMLIVIGLARVRQFLRITKTADSLEKRGIAETDERNVKICKNARSLAFSVYLILGCIASVVLYALRLSTIAKVMSYNLMGIIAIYWICYFLTIKKS